MSITKFPLGQDSISALPENVAKPKYDRSTVKSGIVHIGPSGFFLGHLAVYADDLIASGHKEWGITAVSLKTSRVRDQLSPQDFLYTVHARDQNVQSTRVIGSIKNILVAPENPNQVLELMASPETKLVTLTVTQEGYHFSANGGLNFQSKDIVDSITNSAEPKAAVAFIVEALARRMDKGLDPFAVMSCDNVNSNGDKLRQTVLAYAGIRSKELRHWIEERVDFPNTMVDRIVPKYVDASTRYIEDTFGYVDRNPILTEPHRQLVVGHPDPKNLPPFDKVGATYVKDVEPYELAKIRLLNGGHMALGIMGRLHGYTYTDEALANPAMRKFMEGYMKEVTHTLKPVPGFDVDNYIEGLFTRLENPHMKDELQRLARNGVSKLGSRFLGPLKEAIAHDLPRDHMVDAVAGWVKYLQKADPQSFPIDDQAAYDMQLVALAKSLNGDVRSILSAEIWGSLSGDRTFAQELQEAYAAQAGEHNPGLNLKATYNGHNSGSCKETASRLDIS